LFNSFVWLSESNLTQLNCRAVKLFGASLRLTPSGLA
jgi:hypothetical protein